MKVICINSSNNKYLKRGEQYEVKNLYVDRVSIVNDNFKSRVFPCSRFSTLDGESLKSYCVKNHNGKNVLYHNPCIIAFDSIKIGNYYYSFKNNEKIKIIEKNTYQLIEIKQNSRYNYLYTYVLLSISKLKKKVIIKLN